MADLTKDKDVLQKLYKSCKDYPDKDRFHALYIRALGYPRKVVAELFCRDKDTIQEWEGKWLKEMSVKSRPKNGRPNQIDDKLEETIVKLVEENDPKKHGMNCSFWDCVELQKFFLIQGMSISNETIRRLLKRNGFRYVKAGYEYALADKKERSKFLRNFAKILENFKGSILFFDEMSSKLHPKNGYMWTREENPVVKTFCSHKRVSTMGAVNPLTGSKLTMITRKINRKTFKKALHKIYHQFKGKIMLFLDGFPTHKTNEVKDFLETHPRMKIEYLPKYSPDLNPVEWLWNYSRKKFLNNKCFRSTRQMMSSLTHFFRRMDKSTIKSVCNIDILLNRIT